MRNAVKVQAEVSAAVKLSYTYHLPCIVYRTSQTIVTNQTVVCTIAALFTGLAKLL